MSIIENVNTEQVFGKLKKKEGIKMKTYIAIVHEKGEYDYSTKYEFNSLWEMRDFLKEMQGILVATDCYSTEK